MKVLKDNRPQPPPLEKFIGRAVNCDMCAGRFEIESVADVKLTEPAFENVPLVNFGYRVDCFCPLCGNKFNLECVWVERGQILRAK